MSARHRVGIERRGVGQRTHGITDVPEPHQLVLGRGTSWIGDVVGREKLGGPARRVEMVMRRLTVPRASAIVRPRPMEAVRQPQGSVRAEDRCNGVHRR